MKKEQQHKRCFSYLRFSTKQQEQGSSEERQLEIAEKVSQQKGWELVPEWNAADLGISAYTGSNKETLEAIMQSVKTGIIPQGSVCIIEALDRLTRIPLDDAYQLIRDMLKTGLELFIESADRHLTKADLNNPMSVMLTVVSLDAGFQYSAKLSTRVKEGWSQRRKEVREGRLKLTQSVPGWIDSKTWTINEHGKQVKRIFKMYADGYGITSIVRALNGDKVKTWGSRGTKFSTSYIALLLRSKTVIGELQMCNKVRTPNTKGRKQVPTGEPIKGYYPAVISEKLFYEVQSKLGDSKTCKKTGAVVNLFAGRAYCACGCGTKMFLINSSKGKKYYSTWAKMNGTPCKHETMKYHPIEASFLDQFTTFRKNGLLETTVEDDSGEELRGRLTDLQKQADNITEALTIKVTRSLVEKQSSLEAEIDTLKGQLELSQGRKVSKQSDKAAYLELVKELSKPKQSTGFRMKLRNWILGSLTRMEFDSKSLSYTMSFKTGGTWKVKLAAYQG